MSSLVDILAIHAPRPEPLLVMGTRVKARIDFTRCTLQPSDTLRKVKKGSLGTIARAPIERPDIFGPIRQALVVWDDGQSGETHVDLLDPVGP